MLTLRPAVPEDAGLILQFVRDLAEYEREPQAVVATEDDIRRHAFGERPLIYVTIAEWDGRPAGFALWFLNFSTWTGTPGIYLEDLFVRPEFRRHGIGKALMRNLAALAVENGWTRFVWSVLDWNTPAIEFYRAHGARILSEWVTCRVEGENIGRLAEETD